MPWPDVRILDDLAPRAIDRQRRDMIGGAASVSMFPWVGTQQLHLQPSESPQKGRRAARPQREATPRVAVCVAGAVRALIHPLVWHSLARHVLGRSEGGAGGHDLFAVLGTGAEDQRSRTNELPLDEQPSLRSAAGAYLLSHALSALRPKAVRLVMGTANASCGIPASGQFSKWADCVELVRDHERSEQVRYDVLLKTRPDVLWPGPLLTGRHSLVWLAAALCATPRTVITADDVNVLAHRAAWRVLAGMRGSTGQEDPLGRHSLYCDPLCDSKYWMWMRGIRTNCLMKAHFARHDIHHVDLMGGAAPVHDVLHATQYAAPATGLVPLRLGAFSIVRERTTSTRVSPPRARSPPAASGHQHEGLAVSCAAPPPAPPSSLTGRAAACDAMGALPVLCALCRRTLRGIDTSVTPRGFCGVTEGEGDCAAGQQGAWEVGRAGSTEGVQDLAGCIARCERCSRCNYVSFSYHNEDCSWFHSCDLGALVTTHHLSEHFFTVLVRRPHATAEGSAPAPSQLEPPCSSSSEVDLRSAAGGGSVAREPLVPRRADRRLLGRAADVSACLTAECPACEATLAAFTHVSGGNGPTGVRPLSRAAEEHAQRLRLRIEAAVAAALERRDNRSRARGRVLLTAEERTAAFDSALGSVAPCAGAPRPGGARGGRSRTAPCGGGQRVAASGALRCPTALCHLGRSAVLLLLQPSAVVEQARDAAMRALTRAGGG